MNHIFDFFLEAYRQTPTFQIVLEAIAFVFGVASVWFAKQENILVYPTGIICTVITVYLLYINTYLGDMMMNLYYSIMSIYGWWNWSRKKNGNYLIPISRTSFKEKIIGLCLFALTIIITYVVYKAFDYTIELPNYIDIVTSGIFFTAMWYMANKKLENWTLWIIGDLVTVPLYAYRGLGMLSLQYLIFTILAIYGYNEWKKSLNNTQQTV
ncbi:nicotinamide mononucleotide transporter [Winogradskyella sp. DF17]|uniref:Nicotinamide riboside transporter PnuC n=1 Tax=Winogradskyella pelagia TaxID=2819984 RepID=A0ABS3T557_9FLAO|nr:nicotinamide riboside transporter PnuC [Winogradskyella sp. DF17]MBO3117876.1 nicotinamide mononucleotide transporter [Winogradskyella sp. DF17]